MIVSSRPLRFVAVLLGAWVALRTFLLWPAAERAAERVAAVLPSILGTIAPPVAAAPGPEVAVRGAGADAATRARPVVSAQPISRGLPADRRAGFHAAARPLDHHSPLPADAPPSGRSSAATNPVQPIGSPVIPRSERSRLSVSAWTIIRGGAAASPLTPQLGGSQAGGRLTFALDDARRVSLSARVSSALGSRQREAAVGIDWQPTAWPIHVIAEQRIGIDNVAGGPSLGLIAGAGPLSAPYGFQLEAYGQAGGIARGGRIDGYADGAARLTRPVARVGGAVVDIGVGAWGAAQRGAARLDLGPTGSIRVPVGSASVRLALDWRQRVGGDVRPGSGPALSIGTDF